MCNEQREIALRALADEARQLIRHANRMSTNRQSHFRRAVDGVIACVEQAHRLLRADFNRCRFWVNLESLASDLEQAAWGWSNLTADQQHLLVRGWLDMQGGA
jgi:hypothetical protein